MIGLITLQLRLASIYIPILLPQPPKCCSVCKPCYPQPKLDFFNKCFYYIYLFVCICLEHEYCYSCERSEDNLQEQVSPTELSQDSNSGQQWFDILPHEPSHQPPNRFLLPVYSKTNHFRLVLLLVTGFVALLFDWHCLSLWSF